MTIADKCDNAKQHPSRKGSRTKTEVI